MTGRYVHKAIINNTEDIPICHVPKNKSIEARRLSILFSLGIESIVTNSNEGECEDILAIEKALRDFNSGCQEINVLESGTAMRFLTALFSIKTERKIIISGTARQHNRPIKALVDALRQIGCVLHYIEKDGYPPLFISPKSIEWISPINIYIDASQSSQYLSSLLIAGASLPIGSSIFVTSPIVSYPYVEMTLNCLRLMGVEYTYKNGAYTLSSVNTNTALLKEERDFSSISFLYEIVALMPIGYKLHINNASKSQLQGDCFANEQYFKALGVSSTFNTQGLTLKKETMTSTWPFSWDLSYNPDIMPSLVAALLGNNIPFDIRGIEHLRLKESDRIESMIQEASKLGYSMSYRNSKLLYDGNKIQNNKKKHTITSHHDHRIAMAFAPLISIKHDGAFIDDSEVVKKSFPNYWDEINKLGLISNTRII